MLAFDFDSTLIIKIILIASQPKILEYCSCESYILITFLITLKNCSGFHFHLTGCILEGLFFFNCYFENYFKIYGNNSGPVSTENAELFMINAFLSVINKKTWGFYTDWQLISV